jgi:hypothetical protein
MKNKKSKTRHVRGEWIQKGVFRLSLNTFYRFSENAKRPFLDFRKHINGFLTESLQLYFA